VQHKFAALPVLCNLGSQTSQHEGASSVPGWPQSVQKTLFVLQCIFKNINFQYIWVDGLTLWEHFENYGLMKLFFKVH
jgi:hypothetical protein